jgi:hypothetical protein
MMSGILYLLLDFSTFKRAIPPMSVPEQQILPSSRSGKAALAGQQQQQQQQQRLQRQQPADTLNSTEHFKALALQIMIDRGFGANLPAAVLHYTAAGPRKYSAKQVLQVSLKIHSHIVPSMLPAHAMSGLTSLLKNR